MRGTAFHIDRDTSSAAPSAQHNSTHERSQPPASFNIQGYKLSETPVTVSVGRTGHDACLACNAHRHSRHGGAACQQQGRQIRLLVPMACGGPPWLQPGHAAQDEGGLKTRHDCYECWHMFHNHTHCTVMAPPQPFDGCHPDVLDYLQVSNYAAQLAWWLAFFPPEQILILISAELRDPARQVQVSLLLPPSPLRCQLQPSVAPRRLQAPFIGADQQHHPCRSLQTSALSTQTSATGELKRRVHRC